MTGARFRDDFSTATLGMGDQLSPEVIFGAAIACAVVLALLRKLFWTRRPRRRTSSVPVAAPFHLTPNVRLRLGATVKPSSSASLVTPNGFGLGHRKRMSSSPSAATLGPDASAQWYFSRWFRWLGTFYSKHMPNPRFQATVNGGLRPPSPAPEAFWAGVGPAQLIDVT